MALVMVKFEDGPLRGRKLPVDHTATEYRHVETETAPATTDGDPPTVRTTVHVYRRTGLTTFARDRTEPG